MPDIMTSIAILLVAFLTTAILVPIVVKFANVIGFLDRPTKRKDHKMPIPLVGGVCMFVGFSVAFFVFVGTSDPRFIWVLLGGLIILAIGVVDDYFKSQGKEFRVWPRLLVQIGVACMVFFVAEIRFTGFAIPFTDYYENFIVFPIWLQFALTVTWIFGVITVVNWADGLDGLCGSLCAVTSITIFIVATTLGEPTVAILTLILVGVTMGYLKYNFFPARIYMGDSGSTFLGYMIAVVALYGTLKQATAISVLIPVLALGVPIFDNLFVIFRRLRNKQPIYKADKGQIHHRLLRMGLTPVQALVFLVLLAVVLNLISIIIFLIGA